LMDVLLRQLNESKETIEKGLTARSPLERYPDAEKAYRTELKDHPHNGWSLLGLKQALEGMGTPSSDVATDLNASWSRADTWIQSSRF